MNTELILYFVTYLILYSFAGWVLESVCKTIAQRKIVNSGFLKGPFCPIYGFGAIIMLICLNSLKNSPIILFIASFLTLSIWEYIVGLLLEKLFKTKYWDYSELKFNIQGRICLKNSIYWGILGVLFIRYMHPFIDVYIKMIPIDLLLYINIVIGFAILVDLTISIIQVSKFANAIEKLNDLADSIKNKVEELKKLKTKAKSRSEIIEKNAIENMENSINELKIAHARLKFKMYKHANRLKKAFPSMKSEVITTFFNQKIDLIKLKEKIKNKSIMKKNKE